MEHRIISLYHVCFRRYGHLFTYQHNDDAAMMQNYDFTLMTHISQMLFCSISFNWYLLDSMFLIINQVEDLGSRTASHIAISNCPS